MRPICPNCGADTSGGWIVCEDCGKVFCMKCDKHCACPRCNSHNTRTVTDWDEYRKIVKNSQN